MASKESSRRNPRARWLMSRTVLFMPSRRAFDSPSTMAFGDVFAVGVEGQRGADERLELADACRVDPFVEEPHRLQVVTGLVDGAELVDEQPSAVQIQVGLGELVEDRLVLGAEVVGAAADREAGAFDPRRPLRVCLTEALPQPAPQLVEGLACQLDDVEGVGADPGVFAVGAARADPPAVKIDRHRCDQCAPLRSQRLEERGCGLLATAWGSPYEAGPSRGR